MFIEASGVEVDAPTNTPYLEVVVVEFGGGFSLPLPDESMAPRMAHPELKAAALEVINDRREAYGLARLGGLPTGCTRGDWHECLIGSCFPPERKAQAVILSECNPYVRELERRFEAGKLPEHDAHPNWMSRTLRW